MNTQNILSSDSNGPENNSNISENNSPWIMSIDNIFLDVSRDFPDNRFLEENNIIPGT